MTSLLGVAILKTSTGEIVRADERVCRMKNTHYSTQVSFYTLNTFINEFVRHLLNISSVLRVQGFLCDAEIKIERNVNKKHDIQFIDSRSTPLTLAVLAEKWLWCHKHCILLINLWVTQWNSHTFQSGNTYFTIRIIYRERILQTK